MSQPGLDELTPVNPRSTPALVADRLREQIVSGAFVPGSRMTESQLGARLGVSRGQEDFHPGVAAVAVGVDPVAEQVPS
ncbi:hypothetical protein AA958_34025 [Streptomyces sp. CNQ-509]|nr:hypothetical protein AA958_34025 [Streptomyces sp. CNQ-509]